MLIYPTKNKLIQMEKKYQTAEEILATYPAAIIEEWKGLGYKEADVLNAMREYAMQFLQDIGQQLELISNQINNGKDNTNNT
jgi:hypothetical protein